MTSKRHRAEVMRRARATIARVDEQARIRRCMQLQAHKAMLAIGKMFDYAEPAMSQHDRNAWRTRRALIDDWLKSIAR